MRESDEIELKREIQHIFDSGANEIRILEMVKMFIGERPHLEFKDRNLYPHFFVESKEYNRFCRCGRHLTDDCHGINKKETTH